MIFIVEEWWKIVGFYSFSKGDDDYEWNDSSPRIVILGRILSNVETAPQNGSYDLC